MRTTAGRSTPVIAVMLILTLGGATAVAAEVTPAPAVAGDNSAAVPAADNPGAAGLTKLKSLAGEWKGKTAKGKDVTLSYRPIAGGTAVMEVFSYGQDATSMYTVYHLDGDKLMLTHYCISNNQPRMRAQPSEDPNILRFEFLDATNLARPEDGHMRRAMIRFVDDRHIVNEWTYRKDGKDSFTEAIQWERVK
jgi:hypothetical protein